MILNFDQMNKTKFASVFIMITAWQAHAYLSIISESKSNCEGHVDSPYHSRYFWTRCTDYAKHYAHAMDDVGLSAIGRLPTLNYQPPIILIVFFRGCFACGDCNAVFA